MLVPLRRTSTWRRHTKFYKLRWDTLQNNTRMTNRTDINLIYQHSIISQRFDFEFINRCDFHFWCRTNANQSAICNACLWRNKLNKEIGTSCTLFTVPYFLWIKGIFPTPGTGTLPTFCSKHGGNRTLKVHGEIKTVTRFNWLETDREQLQPIESIYAAFPSDTFFFANSELKPINH